MSTEISRFAGILALLLAGGTAFAAGGEHATWQREAGNVIINVPSLQRGARNFMSFCQGCHSLKYIRYSRLAEDLFIPDELRDKYLVPPGAKFSDYVKTSMPAEQAQEWFGRAPPDLSLVTRSRGTDWVFNFLTTFYADPASVQTGVNNLMLPGTAMPHVLASVQGVPNAVWRNVEREGPSGEKITAREFEKFEPGIPGSVTAEEYDGFVRDTVNFLQYVGEPTQVQRQGIGVWVVLFLLMFTGIAWMLKQEYWKDVH